MTTVTTGGTLLYMAPELLDPGKFKKKNDRPTQPGDVYAFGMVIYEVLTGLEPFYDRNFRQSGKFQIMASVLGGARPTKPDNAECIGFGNGTWELTKECWMEESTGRPMAERILAHLSYVAASSAVVGPTPKIPRDSDGNSSEFNSSSMVSFIFFQLR